MMVNNINGHSGAKKTYSYKDVLEATRKMMADELESLKGSKLTAQELAKLKSDQPERIIAAEVLRKMIRMV